MFKIFKFLLLICVLINTIPQSQSVNVILSFDDGWAEHLQVATDLHNLNEKGVFYINSARIGTSQRLTLDQLHQISDLGHEIGGHTLWHEKLTTQNYTQQQDAICNDRDQLLSWGFNATTFAIPYGADTPEAFELFGACGYNGARDSGGIRTNTSCLRCPKSDNIPPANPQQIRSVSYRSVMGVDGLKWYVSQADADPKYSDGLLAFIFHEYGNHSDKVASIFPSEFIEFVQWLKANNIPIVTTNIINTRIYPNFENLPLPASYGKPFISLTFDDGTEDHMNVAALLEKYDMRGTFFINSGHIGDNNFLKATQLTDLESRGHEVGGHGLHQTDHLLGLTYQEQMIRIQSDYNILTGIGLNITSFAWPYGETSLNLTEIVTNVGYHRARDIGGIKVPTSCSLCPSSIELPTNDKNKMALRSFNVKSKHTAGDLMWQVWKAEDWHLTNPDKQSVLIFSFHTVCNRCSFNPDRFEVFLQWLKPRYKIGTINQKMNNVL